MSLPRILIQILQILLVPLLALMLPLFYGIAWLREVIGDVTPGRVPVVISSRRPRRD